MEPENLETISTTRLDLLTEALESGRRQQIWKMLNELYPAEIAQLLESLPEQKRQIAWQLVNSENQGEVLLNLHDEVRLKLLKDMEAIDIVSLAEGMDTDDLADFLNDLPETVKRQIIHSLDKQNRLQLESVMSYPDDSAGGLMNTDTVKVRADITLELVHRYLQLLGQLPESTDKLLVVNRTGQFLGALPLSSLLTNDPSLVVADVMNRDITTVNANTPAIEVANLFEQRDLISTPVVDDNNVLLGRITIDDVVDVIRGEAEHSLRGMAGLDESSDMFAPVLTSSRRRAIWLGINLLTVLLATWFISHFQDTIQAKLALAVLLPIPASMGGIAGMQTLTLVIRGIALGQIERSNAPWLLRKEIAIGIINGIAWSLIVAAIATMWFNDHSLGIFIAVAMIVNLVCASAAGFGIPFLLRRIGIDPAIAGSVVLTTVTDIIGYITFLGAAALYLLYF